MTRRRQSWPNIFMQQCFPHASKHCSMQFTMATWYHGLLNTSISLNWSVPQSPLKKVTWTKKENIPNLPIQQKSSYTIFHQNSTKRHIVNLSKLCLHYMTRNHWKAKLMPTSLDNSHTSHRVEISIFFSYTIMILTSSYLSLSKCANPKKSQAPTINVMPNWQKI